MNELSGTPLEVRPVEEGAKSVAAIDIGANALRMVVAQVLPSGRVEVLERLQRAVRLGQDTFRLGRLGGQSMRAAVAVIRDYVQILRLYEVQRLRAVATSAVREAGNADTLLDRVFMATGVNVEVIDTAEESRLIVSAVREALGQAVDTTKEDALIIEVGGGSTLLTELHAGRIVGSQSLRLGSVRMQEVLGASEETPARCAELYRQHVTKETTSIPGAPSLERIGLFIAVGGDARFAAGQVGEPIDGSSLHWIGSEEYDGLVRRCVRQTAEELAKRYGIPFAEAETINSALLIYQILWRRTRAQRMIVSGASMRDGLLAELAREVTGREDEALQRNVLDSATAIAEKYHVDVEHATHVADLAVRLFDELQADHGLSSRHRLLLRVAGLLHEIGSFVSSRAHHKHSFYLIGNSEIFGFSRDEMTIVAHVARYHRQSPPKPSHVEYMALPRQSRVIINKLAAILRVADAIVRGHVRQAQNVQLARAGDDLIVYVRGVSDLLLEQRSIATKGDLFEDIYGMHVRLEEA
ncbi:MAG: Ppx/GppA family phosphatase [Pirellulales bacterium]|nr:Ppx/GppA family phosphatase [Pirellulales bacterium]